MNTDDDMMDVLLKQIFEKNPYYEGAKEIKKAYDSFIDAGFSERQTLMLFRMIFESLSVGSRDEDIKRG